MPQPITKCEVKELETAELQTRLSALMAELQQTDNLRVRRWQTISSIENVSGELRRRQADKCDPPENVWL